MEKHESQLLAELILDVKKDVSEMRREVSDVKELSEDNSVVLKEHMRRTEASEARLDVQENKFDEFVKSMEPVQEHVKTVHLITKFGKGFLKTVGILGTIAELVKAFLKFR